MSLSDKEMEDFYKLWMSAQEKKKKKKKKDDETYASKILRTSHTFNHSHSYPRDGKPGETGETSYDQGHRHTYKWQDNGYVSIESHEGHTHY